MPTSENKHFFDKHYLSSQVWMKNLKEMDWVELKKERDVGPAIEFAHPESNGQKPSVPASRGYAFKC